MSEVKVNVSLSVRDLKHKEKRRKSNPQTIRKRRPKLLHLATEMSPS